MGQCVACKSGKVRPGLTAESLSELLEHYHISVINSIHALHKIGLDCNNAIDSCIIENNKPLALLIRCKHSFIKSKTKDLQDLMKKIDDVIPLEKSSKKREVVNECQELEEDLKRFLFNDDVSKILEKNQEYNDNVQKELAKIQLNVKETSIIKHFDEITYFFSGNEI